MPKVRILNPMFDAVEITDPENIPVQLSPIGDGTLTTKGDPIEVGDWAVNQDPLDDLYLVYPKEFIEVVPDEETYPRDGSPVFPPPEELVPETPDITSPDSTIPPPEDLTPDA